MRCDSIGEKISTTAASNAYAWRRAARMQERNRELHGMHACQDVHVKSRTLYEDRVMAGSDWIFSLHS
jgi:hypothetical protein